MKKLLSLVVSSALLFTSLVACSTGAQSSSAAGDTSAASTTGTATTSSDLNVGVFYYTYSDVYITSVRNNMDSVLDTMGVKYQDYDGNNNQANQIDQVKTAITNGCNLLVVNIVETSSPDAAQQVSDAAKEANIPVIFFNREVEDAVISSYDNSAFVGTDAAEAGHMQGEMIATYLLENYDAVDLNGDGKISYVLFKGQEGNAEAEYRTQYAVEDADTDLIAGGKGTDSDKPLVFYDKSNSSGYLVDQDGKWSAAAATNYMNTILSEYSESNGNMVEIIIANNDDMALGAISALQAAGYNKGDGGKTIPVFGVDAVDSAKEKIQNGEMAGTITQDAVGMADTIGALVENIKNGDELMANTSEYNVDSSVAKIRVPYGIYTG